MILLLIKKIINAIATYLSITAIVKGLKEYIPYILIAAGVALLGFLSWCVNEFIRMVKQVFYPVLIYSVIALVVYWFTDTYHAVLWPYYLIRVVL